MRLFLQVEGSIEKFNRISPGQNRRKEESGVAVKSLSSMGVERALSLFALKLNYFTTRKGIRSDTETKNV